AVADLPAKINRVKFLYYNEVLSNRDGSVRCQQIMADNASSGNVKISGQLKLLAEDVFKFPAISEAQFSDPKVKAITYYYRGEGKNSNVIIEAVMTPEGGTFRYFDYVPDDNEVMPTDATEAIVDVALLEKRNRGFLPKNYHFFRVKKTHDISNGIAVDAMSDTSIKGQEAQLDFKDTTDGSTYAVVNLDARINGRKEANVIVPYAVRVAGNYDLFGSVQKGSRTDSVVAVLVDEGNEVGKISYSKDRLKNEETYVISRDITIGDSVASMEIGKSTTDKSFVGIRHITPLSKSVTAVFVVRAGQKEKTISYVVQTNF
ncbi:MAG: hypothetical protein K2Q18_11725, partial [Bdellovibrionales bacterium]|nr:hypothetical protein [Bdellovibrionales bacterium]